MAAYYNDIDPVACDVLEALIKDGVIADGVVDRRSIKEVDPIDLIDFDQCHFFAGSGQWAIALRIAGWPDKGNCWTASAPCQPWSSVGARGGFADQRHLWPEVYRLAKVLRPDFIFGEQVQTPDGRAWFDEVAADLEDCGYACGALDLTPIAIGGSQVRQRLWIVACADGKSPPRVTEPWGKPFHWSAEPPMGSVAHGFPGRMDLLRLEGNGLDPRLAAEVIRALMEVS